MSIFRWNINRWKVAKWSRLENRVLFDWEPGPNVGFGYSTLAERSEPLQPIASIRLSRKLGCGDGNEISNPIRINYRE
jgi:hypothetical protein